MRNELTLSSALYNNIAKPIIADKELSEFEKSVRLGNVITKEVVSESRQGKE